MRLNDISYTVAAQRGRKAATKGEPYSANPYLERTQPGLHLYWSKGHNEARAALLNKDRQPC